MKVLYLTRRISLSPSSLFPSIPLCYLRNYFVLVLHAKTCTDKVYPQALSLDAAIIFILLCQPHWEAQGISAQPLAYMILHFFGVSTEIYKGDSIKSLEIIETIYDTVVIMHLFAWVGCSSWGGRIAIQLQWFPFQGSGARTMGERVSNVHMKFNTIHWLWGRVIIFPQSMGVNLQKAVRVEKAMVWLRCLTSGPLWPSQSPWSLWLVNGWNCCCHCSSFT